MDHNFFSYGFVGSVIIVSPAIYRNQEKGNAFHKYRNNSINWDTVCIGTPSVLEKIIILMIILIGTY